MGTNNTTNNNRKLYIIMGGLVTLGIMTYFIWVQVTPNVQQQITQLANETTKAIKENSEQIKNTSIEVNITKQGVKNLSENQAVGLENQKILAKGLNDLGSAVIPTLTDISNKTNLIDDIKFNTDVIANKTELKNVTLP